MEAFTENMRTNTSLIRRKIKDSHLWLETFQIGKVTQTSVSIMYLTNLASPDLVLEVKRRLDQIDTDSILESGYIEEFIQDKTATPFPTIYNTDRPDTIAAGILEGKWRFLWTERRLSCWCLAFLSPFSNLPKIIISGPILAPCCGLFAFFLFYYDACPLFLRGGYYVSSGDDPYQSGHKPCRTTGERPGSGIRRGAAYGIDV